MRSKLITMAIIVVACVIPEHASAHTGSVTCDKTGVVFSYNANFANTTVVTEVVNGVSSTFTVPARTAAQHSVPAPAASVTASASWRDGNAVGSIPKVTLTCPYTPPVCVPTVVEKIVETPGPTVYVNVPGPIQYVDRWNTVIKFKTKVKWKTRIKLIPYTVVLPPKKPKRGGVAG